MTYVIAECGGTHNGSMEIARALIEMAADPRPADMKEAPAYPCDAVKFTKRDLDYECSASMMASAYNGRHSFGSTYGEHRAALELSATQHFELYRIAKDLGLDFVETICHPNCLSLLDLFTPDYIKIASRDLTNLPLIEACATTSIPLILSTGMGGRSEIGRALELAGSDVTLMHCLSSYPSELEDLNLRRIQVYAGGVTRVGYSDHSIGIVAPVAAVALGATMIEKHVTLSRTMRGTDHAGSLERDGLWRMVRDIRNVEMALGSPEISEHPASKDAKAKLERSLATARQLPAGSVIAESDLTLLSPGGGYRWSEREGLIGTTVSEDLARHELIPRKIVGTLFGKPMVEAHDLPELGEITFGDWGEVK